MKRCRCVHEARVGIDPSIRFGGVSVGRCDRDALPLMVVCERHATREAMAMVIRQLAKQERTRP